MILKEEDRHLIFILIRLHLLILNSKSLTILATYGKINKYIDPQKLDIILIYTSQIIEAIEQF
jgi:hypothetical protein